MSIRIFRKKTGSITLLTAALILAGVTGCSILDNKEESREVSTATSSSPTPSSTPSDLIGGSLQEQRNNPYADQGEISDALVEQDVRNVSTAIETALISNPNAKTVSGDSGNSDTLIIDIENTEVPPIYLNNGVHIQVIKDPKDEYAYSYIIKGWHDDGNNYPSEEEALFYYSARGGFQN